MSCSARSSTNPARIASAPSAGPGPTQPTHARRDHQAWLHLLIAVLNRMNAMSGWVPTAPAVSHAPPSAAQLQALKQLASMVEQLLAATTIPIPSTDWAQKLVNSRLTYTGEVVAKSAPLTWRQIEPALPPQHLSGRLDPLAVAAPPLAELLATPALSLKPPEEWPQPIRNARVHVPRVADGLRPLLWWLE